jgi:hypothetical protein
MEMLRTLAVDQQTSFPLVVPVNCVALRVDALLLEITA